LAFLGFIMSFKEQKYEVIRNAISSELASFIDTEFELIKNFWYLHLNAPPSEGEYPYGDQQVPNSFSFYSPFCFESLSIALLPLMEEVTGKELYQTYTYGRIYYKGATMKKHTDRGSCEYSGTINLSTDDLPWEIWFENTKGEDVSITLEPGDMIIYQGMDLNHWRNEFLGDRLSQAFLHYVDKNGPYADLKFDQRPYLGFPSNSRR